MTEAAQRAGIEINLNIAGIEDLENVHNKVNSLINDLPRLKESLNGLNINLGIDDQFKQAVVTIAKMTGDINKMIDDQHQQTQAVRETNSALKEITGVEEKILSGQTRQTDAIRTTNVQIGQTRMAVNEISHAQDNVTSSIHETESATSSWKDKLSGLKEKVSGLKEKLNVKGTINEDNESAHRFGSTLESLQSKADKTSHLFGKMLGANLISNGISNAFASITGHISEAKEAVSEYNDKQQVMIATWDTLTGNAQKGQAMVDVGNNLSKAYGQNIEVVDELNQKFYHVFNNKGQTEQLTKSVLTLGDTLGMTGADVNRLGENFTHMMTSGKMQMGDFNHISDQLPMFGEKLLEQQKKIQHNSSLTMQQLQNQMSAGKISAKDAEDVMNELGDKYQKASENLMKTLPGMRRMIQSQSKALANDIYNPIANMKNPIFEGVSKWVKDNKTSAEFKKVGDNIATQITRVTKAFDIKSVNVTGGLDGMMNSLDKGITNLGNTIVKNKGSIKDLFTIIKDGTTGSFKVFIELLKILEPLLKVTAETAAKHPKIFAAVTLSMLAAGKAMSIFVGAVEGLKAIKDAIALMKEWEVATKIMTGLQIAFNFVLDANPIGMIVLGITAAIAVIALLYTKVKPFRDFINGLGKMIVNVFKGVMDFFKNNWKTIGLFIISPFAGIAKVLYDHVKPFRDFVNTVGGVIKKGFEGFVKFIKNPVKSMGDAFNPLKDKIGKIFDDLGKKASSAGKTIGDSFKNAPKNVQTHMDELKKGVTNTFDFLQKNSPKQFDGMWKTINQITKDRSKVNADLTKTSADLMSGHWNNLGKDLNKTTTDFWNGIRNAFKNSYDWLDKLTGGRLADILNWFIKINKSINDTIIGMWNAIKNTFNTSLNWVSNLWNNSWTSIFNFGKGIWNGITGTLNDWWNAIKNTFKSAGSAISSIWSDTWNGVAKTFSNIWDGIKQTAHDGVKSIVNVLNSGINGIDDVIGMFGGNKNSLKPIKFANGTGALDHHTYSMLNDGNDSPETGNKELAIFPNGKAFMPLVRNWTGFLPKGTAVLNATETKLLMQMQNIQHFAKGGIVGGIESMFSGAVDTVKNVGGSIWGSIKGFGSDLKKGFDMATSIATDPGKYIQDLIKSPNLKGDVMENLGKGMFDKTKDSASDFWNTTWKEVSSILESGGGSGSMGEFLQYAIKNFTGREYVYGGFDCSEMVKEALEHFGINGIGRTTVAQEASGKLQSLGGDIHKTKPGDLVYFGTSGADAHVGIVSDVNRGLMMNQHPERGGVSSIAAAEAKDGPGRYYHVKGLSSDDGSGDKKSKNDTGLTKFVHNMFDNNMFKFIQDKLAPFGETVDSGGVPSEAPKGDHKNWMKQAGIPESWMNSVNEIVFDESSWKANAKNGKYYGLPQTTTDNLAKAGSDWRDNPITQLKAMKMYIKDRYGDANNALKFRKSHNWYENGGLIDHEQTATMGEGNKLEAIIPLTKRNRAFEILRSIFGIMKPTNNEKNDMGINPHIKTNSHSSDFYSPNTNYSSGNQELNVGNSDKETLIELKKANELNRLMFEELKKQTQLSKEEIDATKDSKVFDKQELYRKQALDQRIVDTQSF